MTPGACTGVPSASTPGGSARSTAPTSSGSSPTSSTTSRRGGCWPAAPSISSSPFPPDTWRPTWTAHPPRSSPHCSARSRWAPSSSGHTVGHPIVAAGLHRRRGHRRMAGLARRAPGPPPHPIPPGDRPLVEAPRRRRRTAGRARSHITTATGELPEGGWLIAMVTGLTALLLLGAGIVLGIAHLASRRAAA